MPSEVAIYDVACQVGKAYNICPLVSWSFLEGLDTVKRSRSFFESELIFSGQLWHDYCCGRRLGSLTSSPLCRVCTWAGLFGSECNSCFGLWVMHFKGSCFNFWGLRLLLRLFLTIRLTLDALAYLYLSDWELRFNSSMPCLLRPWVGGVYLYPFIIHIVLYSKP